MSSTHTLSVNIFNLEEGETMLARDKGNFHAPDENRTRHGPGFILPSTIDDWTVLKITEKIIQRNVFFYQKKKKPGLSADRPSYNFAQ